jgi:hypothetical protein
LLAAEIAAREMDTVNLADALRLSLLIAEADPERWSRAAARWHSLFVQEATGIDLDDAALAPSALRALPGPHRTSAAHTLRHLAKNYGLRHVVVLLQGVRKCVVSLG